MHASHHNQITILPRGGMYNKRPTFTVRDSLGMLLGWVQWEDDEVGYLYDHEPAYRRGLSALQLYSLQSAILQLNLQSRQWLGCAALVEGMEQVAIELYTSVGMTLPGYLQSATPQPTTEERPSQHGTPQEDHHLTAQPPTPTPDQPATPVQREGQERSNDPA
jgi:hypothetical protein